MIGLGIPEIEAKRYEEKLKKGNYLIAVHADESEDVDRAKDIFKTALALNYISTVSEASVLLKKKSCIRGKSMANENAMNQGPVVPPEAEKKAEQGVKHARKAAEDLARLLLPWPTNIGAAWKKYGTMRSSASGVSGRWQAICP